MGLIGSKRLQAAIAAARYLLAAAFLLSALGKILSPSKFNSFISFLQLPSFICASRAESAMPCGPP